VRVVHDRASGEVVELRCSYDPASRGGRAPDGRKVRGTLHWVSARHARPAEVRLYDRLFRTPQPLQDDGDWLTHLNPDSLQTLRDARVEPALAQAAAGAHFQFERLGYFCVDSAGSGIFNRTVALRDAWKPGSR